MNNHTVSIEIASGINSQAFFCFNEPDKLIVFVHGFGGNAIETWNNFPAYLISDSKFSSADIVFYGYDTFKGQAGEHSAELFDFLNLMEHPLNSGILPENQNLPERKYDRIILVAHSLGAVLARQAQLLAHLDSKSWVDNSNLALYAPAHHGAKIISLASESLSGIFSIVGILAKYKYPILNDLDSNEDGILNAIKAKTESLQSQGVGDFTKAKLVVYAKGDKVVRDFQYLDDAPPKVIPNQSHTSVCKPKNNYMNPMDLLKTII